jgi:MFS family permease
MKFSTNHDLKNSIYDGMFANMFATLTGGVFLTGFGLFLGMNEFMIGILASMPFLVTVFQLPTSYFIEKSGGKKKISIRAAAVARLSWIPIFIFALLPFPKIETKTFVILAMIFFSYAFISISYVSWLSWISDLVPDETRGRFFGTRNMVCGAAGITVMIVFGNLLDFFKNNISWGLPLGFSITFMAAVSLGILSLRFLSRISELPINKSYNKTPFVKQLSIPLKETNFRKFAIFSLFWSFSVYFASPFLTLYFLRELKFSYGFVATLGMISALSDMTGMWVWGKFSDKVKNKPIIHFAGWVAAFLPLAWVMVRPGRIFIPIVLHLIGGGFWAGINLCMNNLLLRVSPLENRSLFISIYSIMGGIGAATGPILAGLILKSIGDFVFNPLSWTVFPLHIIFITSTFLRLISLQLIRYINEPEEPTVGQMIRVLRSVRGLNMTNGFNHLIHPFIEVSKRNNKTRKSESHEIERAQQDA